MPRVVYTPELNRQSVQPFPAFPGGILEGAGTISSHRCPSICFQGTNRILGRETTGNNGMMFTGYSPTGPSACPKPNRAWIAVGERYEEKLGPATDAAVSRARRRKGIAKTTPFGQIRQERNQAVAGALDEPLAFVAAFLRLR